jgi:hypothetical protein
LMNGPNEINACRTGSLLEAAAELRAQSTVSG